MDLAISPDWDARWCYAVVLAGGFIAACEQMRRRLRAAAWYFGEAWLLFGAYLVMPPILFWLLDAGGAVQDTSLFAALLVGFAYERILTGKLDSITAKPSTAGLYAPFIAWADDMTQRVLERLQQRHQAKRNRVIDKLVPAPDLITALEPVLMKRIEKPGVLQAELVKVRADQTLIDLERNRKLANLLYNELELLPARANLLLEAGVITRQEYWTEFDSRLKRLQLAGQVVLVVLLLVFLSSRYWPADPELEFQLWRVRKTGTTDLDLYRAREVLAVLSQDEKQYPLWRARILESLRRPGLTVERIDLLLGILLQGRHNSKKELSEKELEELTQALRTNSTEARSRVHHSLMFLFQELKPKETLPGELKNWIPVNGDSAVAVEQRISQWQNFLGGAAEILPIVAPPVVPPPEEVLPEETLLPTPAPGASSANSAGELETDSGSPGTTPDPATPPASGTAAPPGNP